MISRDLRWMKKNQKQTTPAQKLHLPPQRVEGALHLSNGETRRVRPPRTLDDEGAKSPQTAAARGSLATTMEPKCLYGLDGSDSGFEMSFDSDNEVGAFSLDDTMGSEGFASSAASMADEDLLLPKPPAKKRRQRRTRERSPTQVRC